MPEPTAMVTRSRSGDSPGHAHATLPSPPAVQAQSERSVPRGATAGDAMIHTPRTAVSTATVGQVRTIFQDDHIHCVLIVEDGTLLAVVEPTDLEDRDAAAPAWPAGALHGRIIAPEADLDAARRTMTRSRRRRLAVVDGEGTLRGLLCLKRSGLGFCTDAYVQARAAERERHVAAASARRAR